MRKRRPSAAAFPLCQKISMQPASRRRVPQKRGSSREALIGLVRQKGMLQKGKTPVYFEELQEMISRMDLRTLHGLRDRAILLIGFMGAFRRSELVSLTMEDIRKFPQGIVLHIKRSKTDQRGEGQQAHPPSEECT